MKQEKGTLVERLAATPLFDGVSDELVRDVAGSCAVERYLAGDKLIEEGKDGADSYIVMEGEVEIRAGKYFLVSRRKGELVGEFAVLDRQVRSSAAVASTSVRALRIPRDVFDQLLAKSDRFVRNVIHVLVGKLRQSVEEHRRLLQTLERLESAVARGPFPVARAYACLDQAQTGVELKDALISFMDALLQYLGAVAGGVLAKLDHPNRGILFGDSRTGAGWMPLVKLGLAPENLEKAAPWLSFLVEGSDLILSRRGKKCNPGRLLTKLEEFSHTRNEWVHGGVKYPDEIYREMATRWLEEMVPLVQDLTLFAKTHLVATTETKLLRGGRCLYAYQDLSGIGIPFTSRTKNSEAKLDLEPEAVSLVASDWSGALVVEPYLRFGLCRRCNAVTGLRLFQGSAKRAKWNWLCPVGHNFTDGAMLPGG